MNHMICISFDHHWQVKLLRVANIISPPNVYLIYKFFFFYLSKVIDRLE